MRTVKKYQHMMPGKLFRMTFLLKQGIVGLAMLIYSTITMAQLGGVYTIDASKAASATNYQTFGSAVSDLVRGTRADGGTANGKGVNAAVVFNVASGTYNEQISIDSIPGTSAKNRITFQSANGKKNSVILTSATNTTGVKNYIVEFNKCSYIKLHAMTLQRAGVALYRTIIAYNNPSNYITIDSCSILGLPNISGNDQASSLIYVNSPNHLSGTSKHFTYNKFYGGINSICIYSLYDSTEENDIQIIGNEIDSFSSYGLDLQSIRNLNIEGNYFKDFGGNGSYGMKIDTCHNVQIIKNRINSTWGSIGIYAFRSYNDSGTLGKIINNSISISGNNVSTGLYSYNLQSFYIANNSVYINYTGKDSSQATRTFSVTLNDDAYKIQNSPLFVHFFNNNLVNSRGRALKLAAFSAMTYKCDYNNYFQKGDFGTFWVYKSPYKVHTFSTLKMWRDSTGFDLNSIAIDPKYTSATDLHPNNALLSGTGGALSLVTDDMDGKTRDTASPTPGAYELPACINITLTADDACLGSATNFTSSLTPVSGTVSSVSMDFGDGSTATSAVNSHTYKSAGNYTLTLSATTSTGCSASRSIIVKVHDDCVWPGDANASKKADIYDFLSVALAYSDTGASRKGASSKWVGQLCDDWSKKFKIGVNHKQADCNGDGQVDSFDIVPIISNYGKSHPKKGPDNALTGVGPLLKLQFPADSIKAGSAVDVKILLGTQSKPADSIYGIVFSVTYDPTMLDSSQLSLDVSNSWMGKKKDLITMLHWDKYNGQIDLGIARYDHTNVKGYGQIGSMKIIITDDAAGKVLKEKALNLNIVSYNAISAQEKVRPIGAEGDTAIVYKELGSVASVQELANEIKLYPNPSDGGLYLGSDKLLIQGLSLTDITGRVVWQHGAMPKGTSYITLPELRNGVYMMRINTDKGVLNKTFMLNR